MTIEAKQGSPRATRVQLDSHKHFIDTNSSFISEASSLIALIPGSLAIYALCVLTTQALLAYGSTLFGIITIPSLVLIYLCLASSVLDYVMRTVTRALTLCKLVVQMPSIVLRKRRNQTQITMSSPIEIETINYMKNDVEISVEDAERHLEKFAYSNNPSENLATIVGTSSAAHMARLQIYSRRLRASSFDKRFISKDSGNLWFQIISFAISLFVTYTAAPVITGLISFTAYPLLNFCVTALIHFATFNTTRNIIHQITSTYINQDAIKKKYPDKKHPEKYNERFLVEALIEKYLNRSSLKFRRPSRLADALERPEEVEHYTERHISITIQNLYARLNSYLRSKNFSAEPVKIISHISIYYTPLIFFVFFLINPTFCQALLCYQISTFVMHKIDLAVFKIKYQRPAIALSTVTYLFTLPGQLIMTHIISQAILQLLLANIAAITLLNLPIMTITYLITWVYLSAEIVQSSKSVANTLFNFSQFFIGVLNPRKLKAANANEQTHEPSDFLAQALTPREVLYLSYTSSSQQRDHNATDGIRNGN